MDAQVEGSRLGVCRGRAGSVLGFETPTSKQESLVSERRGSVDG